MAHKSCVTLVAVANDDAVAEFAANLTVVADGRSGNTIADYLRVPTDGEWTN
jgi:hypothetical protein